MADSFARCITYFYTQTTQPNDKNVRLSHASLRSVSHNEKLHNVDDRASQDLLAGSLSFSYLARVQILVYFRCCAGHCCGRKFKERLNADFIAKSHVPTVPAM
jgi:hypothetical protein